MAYNPLYHPDAALKILGFNAAVDMNTTGNNDIPIQNASLYIIEKIVLFSPSVNLALAAGGIYTGLNKSGSVIVPATQIYTALTGSNKYLILTLGALPLTDAMTAATLYLSLTLAQGAAATAKIAVFGSALENA